MIEKNEEFFDIFGPPIAIALVVFFLFLAMGPLFKFVNWWFTYWWN